MNPEDKIKKLIDKSDIMTDVQTDRRILCNALEYLEKLKQQEATKTTPNIWRGIMRGRMAQLAVAAAIIFVFGIGFSVGRWSKPARPALYTLDVTGYTSVISAYPTAPKAEDGFWRQKAIAAIQPRPYMQTQTTKTALLNAYKQYLKEKDYD